LHGLAQIERLDGDALDGDADLSAFTVRDVQRELRRTICS
jgi:hypothetical protein